MGKGYGSLVYLLVCAFLLAYNPADSLGQTSQNTNLGFENGNFGGWSGFQWEYTTVPELTYINTAVTKVTLPTARRHVILSDTAARDANTGNILRTIPKGYKYSARLGDATKTSDSKPRCWEQSLRYSMHVDSSNAYVSLKFACVLQYSAQHDNITEFEPRFSLSTYDAYGNKLASCFNVDIYASHGAISGFKTYQPSALDDPVRWKDWTIAGANLSNYIGQDITIELTTADCTGQFHYGYIYFVMDAQPMKILADFCGSADTARLTAPEGFVSYRWRDMNTLQIINADTTLSSISIPMINNNSNTSVYHCIMRSSLGCIDSITVNILKYKPISAFSSQITGTCIDNNVEFTSTSSSNRGTLTYLWDYGDGTTYATSSTQHIHHFQTSGLHNITLTTYNPPSNCISKVNKKIESINTDLVKLKTGNDSICLGTSAGSLMASGATLYKWSNDPDAAAPDTVSIKTDLPAGAYWVIGYDSQNKCASPKHEATLSSERSWKNRLDGPDWICEGSTSKLLVSGWYVDSHNNPLQQKPLLSYLWSNGSTTDTTTISKGGSYSVVTTDTRGCSRTLTINIDDKTLPLVDFSLSPPYINPKQATVYCSINQEPDVAYQWFFADDSTQMSGTNTIHSYNYKLPPGLYPITLNGTNTTYGCFNSITKYILMEPFIPNIFTPNNDGYNDYFMPKQEVDIYDRWGVLIYSGTTDSKGWDGTYKGIRIKSDTYFYVLHYTGYENIRQTKKGYITLTR